MKPINPEKEQIIVLVNKMLDRSSLNIEQVVARMQLAGCTVNRNTFENRFTTRVHQRPNIPEGWVLTLIQALRNNLAATEKCTAEEALELCQLARLPLEQFERVKEYFPALEFAQAMEKMLSPSYFIHAHKSGTADKLSTDSSQQLSQQQPEHHAVQQIEWGNAPDPAVAHGRKAELREMTGWLSQPQCRAAGIFGLGGVGKSTLAAQLVVQLAPKFDYVYWYSLQQPPSLHALFGDLLTFLLGPEQAAVAQTMDERRSLLWQRLQHEHVLIILDGYEHLLEAGDNTGVYRLGYEDYGSWLREFTERAHASQLLLTSREKPLEFPTQAEAQKTIYALTLQGLDLPSVQLLLQPRRLTGTEADWQQLHTHYTGNPLALQLAAEPINNLFAGSIAAFLESDVSLFQKIEDLLNQQFSRLALLERELLYWLAIEREAVRIETLQEDVGESVPTLHLLEALHSLLRRSFIEQVENKFTAPKLVQTYLAERLITLVGDELEAGIPLLLTSFALVKTQSKEHIRELQLRKVVLPIVKRLMRFSPRQEAKVQLLRMLQQLQQAPSFPGNYGAGNLFNLLVQLNVDLRGHDFSNLELRHADLRTTTLQDVNFANTTFQACRFWESFTSIATLAYSQDGEYIAAGMTNGELHLWLFQQEELRYRLLGHTDMIWEVVFSPDDSLLATACEDHTVRIWQVSSGECLQTLTAHGDWVKSVCFIAQGRELATAGHDAIVRIWDVGTGECLRQWHAHTDWIWSINSSPDGDLLATASQDHTVKLWDPQTGHCRHRLSAHTEPIRTATFSPTGECLLSAGFDHTLRVWDVESGEQQLILQGHENLIWSAAYSPDGTQIVSGGDDPHIFLWHAESGELLHKLQGHQNRLWALAFHPAGKIIASGGDDQRLRFWSTQSGQSLRHFAGYSNQIWSLATHPTAPLLASGGDDGTVRLWEHGSGRSSQFSSSQFLQGHSERVRCIAFGTTGETIATGGDDQTVRIWDVRRNLCLHTLYGHQNRVWSVAYRPDGKRLVSCSEDQTICLWNAESGQLIRTFYTEGGRIWSIAHHPIQNLLASSGDGKEILLWDLDTGQCVQVWEGHQARVWRVTFNADGSLLASGGADYMVIIWNSTNGSIQHRLTGHQSAIWTIVFSPDGKWLASSGDDQYICIWHVASGQLHQRLHGHVGCVWSLTFLTSTRLASGGQDETIYLWDVESGELLSRLHSERPYERMNISHVRGLSAAQKSSLGTLGAVEQ